MARICDNPYTFQSTTPIHKLGSIFDGVDELGLPAKFRFVKFDGLASAVAGDVAEFNSLTLTSVTDDKSGGSPASLGRCPAGIFCVTPIEDSHGYVLVQGYHSAVQGDGSVSAGQAVMSHASTDGAADTQTAAGKQIGVALADDAGSPITFPGYFNFL